jgi:hypothetical protein
MANKDLFKQAIAEAKSVREAAIANAKEALEETLTPHLKDMLAAKLQEMEEKDIEEEVVNEEEVTEEEVTEAQGNIDAHEENPADQLEEELTFEEEEGEEESEESEEAEVEDAEEEEVEVKDMEVDDLKDLIRDIIAQEMGDEEAGEEIPGEELPADDMVGAEDDEEIDLDELLRELGEVEEGSHNKDHDSMEEGDYKKDHDSMEEEIDEVKPGYGVGTVGKDNPVVDFINKIAAKGGELGKEAMEVLRYAGSSAGKAMRNEEEIAEEAAELNEAVDTINSLKAQLQEVNLLNAKLLYVNKVFKANNLTESQKVNVIAAFDKAETVKEAKLVFETVSENVVGKTTKSSIKESKLGMASKATGTTASKPEVISEVSDAVKRMQKLAGIIK